ncbi:uncharacterized protein LOC132736655 isoform X2 [Ruditapes philippinarum]|uniref:uncharacterized protein LOC132736655 isoform X2 n=1 Tax=Ruditapes philippinarum TaxID=129788 RepID=UPI00295B3B4D|nr:uncharacterized protein LOC132736655 isoform X2 [Ruditapes philippinarum]
MIMLRESAGLLVFVTLLATYACDTSGSKDDSPSANKRFLLDGNAVPSNISLEQFASCYLTCTPTYGKLLETCCKSGLNVVCSNLPWDILKPKLGSCPGLSKSPTTSAWLSLEQFAACFLTCVVGFEKLTEACCQTGLDAICTNLPWEILQSQLGSCRSDLSTKPSTLPQPFWSSWGTWTCGHQGSICFQTRERNCSTGVDKDCEFQPGEMPTNVRLCSESTCPDFFSTKVTSTTASTTPATHPNHCLSCSDVVHPSDCTYQVLCYPGELCYTEYINLNGADRYRMGCIASTACAKTIAQPSLVGKKRFVADDQIGMEKYCSKCCQDSVGNCNRELCGMSSNISSGVDVFELITPPKRHDFCGDLFPATCQIVILQSPELCKDPRYSYYACREFCGTCVNPGHNTGKPPTTVQSGNTDCFYDSTRYMGGYSTSVSGKPCLSWSHVDPTLTGFPDGSISAASNKCRDPDNRGFPWCYTSDTFDWEFCPVPFCQECFYANQSQKYDGFVHVDKKNNTCKPWTNYVAHTGDTNVNFPNNSVADAKNYCRDPKNSGTPQCYNGIDLKACDVAQCPHECRDDPLTNCALVQHFVCKYEYASVTLCPKTCDMCTFGLLPPVKLNPPADICVDNTDANCEILQSIICADPDGAIKLCPKTCRKCNVLYGISTKSAKTFLTTKPQTFKTSTIISTSTSPLAQSTVPITKPVWLPWESWVCNRQSDSCFQRRFRNCSTGNDNDCIQSQGGEAYSIGLCMETTCPAIAKPHWSPWGSWDCELQDGACFQRRFRNCSTGIDNDCVQSQGDVSYNINVCTQSTCPEMFTRTTQMTTIQTDLCEDDPKALGCTIPDILSEVCRDKQTAWNLCRRSCRLCDTCWDYLNCTTKDAQNLFCGKDEYAIQYCRQTCGRCDHKPVDVQLNKCGDPVTSEVICEQLQNEICICNDSALAQLCGNYCANKCIGYPFPGSNCLPARRKKRDEILNQVVFN